VCGSYSSRPRGASRLGFGNYNEVSTSTSDDEDTDENLDYPPGKPPAHEYV
jgi:hypothetical protein